MLLSSSSFPFSSSPVSLKGDPLLPVLTHDRLATHTQHTHTHTVSLSPRQTHAQIKTLTPAPCTRISHWLHSSQIRSIFHPSKNHPHSSQCSLEAKHCCSYSCVTSINHPSMWNSYSRHQYRGNTKQLNCNFPTNSSFTVTRHLSFGISILVP